MLDHNQIIAVEKFAQDLKTCYENRKKDHFTDEPLDKMIVATLNYAISILDLHLELANRNFDIMAQEEAVKNG